MKKAFFSLFFLSAIYLHCDSPANQVVVILQRNEACSVIINRCGVECGINCNISFESAQELVGTGDATYGLGTISMYLFNNQPDLPYELELRADASNYDAVNDTYIALNGSSELVIGVQKDFNISGERIEWTFIDPTSNPILLRQSYTKICCESHTLYFYILESENNSFVDGTYTAEFTLYFTTP